MGTLQSRPQDIQDLRAASGTHRFIARRFKCSIRAISAASKGDGQPKKLGGQKKINPAMSSYIETLACLDSSLTNREILMMFRLRWPRIPLSESLVSAERIQLGFTWRRPLVKQDLTIAQDHQRLRFANDLMAMAIDPTKIIFSDESRFVIGDDHRWLDLRRGEWTETAFVHSTKFPESVMIWGTIGLDYKSGCFHCSHGVDSCGYQSILLRSEFVENLNNRYGALGWHFMQDGVTAQTSRATAVSSRRVV
jgi:hypothetical protein